MAGDPVACKRKQGVVPSPGFDGKLVAALQVATTVALTENDVEAIALPACAASACVA